MAKRTLTDEQRKVLDNVESSLSKALEDASARMAGAGFDPNEPPTNGSFGCLRCDCEGFRGGPGITVRCRTPGCGHSFFSHDVF